MKKLLILALSLVALNQAVEAASNEKNSQLQTADASGATIPPQASTIPPQVSTSKEAASNEENSQLPTADASGATIPPQVSTSTPTALKRTTPSRTR